MFQYKRAHYETSEIGIQQRANRIGFVVNCRTSICCPLYCGTCAGSPSLFGDGGGCHSAGRGRGGHWALGDDGVELQQEHPASGLPDNQQDRDMIARELLIKFQMSESHPMVELMKAYRKF